MAIRAETVPLIVEAPRNDGIGGICCVIASKANEQITSSYPAVGRCFRAAANPLERSIGPVLIDSQISIGALYVGMRHIGNQHVDGELKKGSAELLILSLIEHRPRHGYEIAKLIETRSAGVLRFNVASLYPLLYRLEQRALIKGQWVEKSGQRRRRFYQLTAQGRKMLKHQQGMWREFVNAMELITGAENA